MDQRIPFPRPDGEEAFTLLNKEYFALFQADDYYSKLKTYGVPGRIVSTLSQQDEKPSPPSLPRIAKEIHTCRMDFLKKFALQKLMASGDERCEFRVPEKHFEPEKNEENPDEPGKQMDNLIQQQIDEVARQENTMRDFETHVQQMVSKLDDDVAELATTKKSLTSNECAQVKMISGVITAIFDANPEARMNAANYAALVASLS